MTDPTRPLSDAFVAEIVREFPSFAIVPKRTSTLQKAIHWALVLLTFGGQRVYLTRYHTALFGKLWVPDAYEQMSDVDRYILLRHERVHLRQRRRLGDVKMTFLYLLWYAPLFLSYGRARIEWEAYEETLRATAEQKGLAAAEALRPFILARYVGPDYGWMWPFPKTIHGWFDETMRTLRVDVDVRQ